MVSGPGSASATLPLASPEQHNSVPVVAMLIEIDGLPGGNKSTLVSALAAALQLPELPATTVELVQTQRADDPNFIALVSIGHLAGRAAGPASGVRKWSTRSAKTYFLLRFSSESTTAAASIYAATFAHLTCPKPQLLVLVDMTVDQSAEQGGGGLTRTELAELKMAEQKTR